MLNLSSLNSNNDDFYLKILKLNTFENLNQINKRKIILLHKHKNELKISKQIEEAYNYFICKGDKFDNAQEIMPNMFLGSVNVAYNHNKLHELNITHILSVADEFPPIFNDMINLHVGIKDELNIEIDTSKIKKCVNFINDARKNGNILIHCQYGKTRSAIITTLFLSKELNLPVKEAYDYLLTKREVFVPENILRNFSDE